MGGRTDREERFELCRAKRRSEKLGKALSAFWRQSNFFDFKESLTGGPPQKKTSKTKPLPSDYVRFVLTRWHRGSWGNRYFTI